MELFAKCSIVFVGGVEYGDLELVLVYLCNGFIYTVAILLNRCIFPRILFHACEFDFDARSS